MSVSMTMDQVRARTKRVTRRREETWKRLDVGDHLVLIEKGMGLPKGAKQVVITTVVVTGVRVELLSRCDDLDATFEGFPDMTGAEFQDFWRRGHGCSPGADPLVRRIEWRYLTDADLDEGAAS